MLLLAIQCVLHDSHKTLALVPDLDVAQKNMTMYLMDSNGLLERPGDLSGGGHAQQERNGDGHEHGHAGEIEADAEERKERVVEEMAGLMSRGVA